MATKIAPKKKTAKKRVPSKKSPVKKNCFVMMPFKDPFDLYYSSIFKPAIESSNLIPIRADDLFRPSVIVSDIWNMVKDADVLIAELTTKNANVFYELGLAHAVGKPVILVSEIMDDVPFDLQQLRVLLYDKNNPSWGENLKESIASSLKEVITDPIEAVPTIFRTKTESFAPVQDEVSSRLEDLENQVRLLRIRPVRPAGGINFSSRLRELNHELDRVHSEEDLDDLFMQYRDKLPKRILLKEIGNNPSIPDGEAQRLSEKFGSA